jgi:ABC-type iron transport system FetAB permease component
LTAAQAVSVTTAAAAVVAYLNSQPSYSQYMTASNVAGVITNTINALSTAFLVTAGSGTTVTDSYYLSISGMIVNNASNGWTIAASSTGGTIANVTTQWAGGTGYKGTVPGYVPPS